MTDLYKYMTISVSEFLIIIIISSIIYDELLNTESS